MPSAAASASASVSPLPPSSVTPASGVRTGWLVGSDDCSAPTKASASSTSALSERLLRFRPSTVWSSSAVADKYSLERSPLVVLDGPDSAPARHLVNRPIIRLFAFFTVFWLPILLIPHWAPFIVSFIAYSAAGIVCLPAFHRCFPSLGPSVLAFAGLDRAVHRGRLPSFILHLIYWPFLFSTLLNGIGYYLFYTEVPNTQRKTFFEYAYYVNFYEWNYTHIGEYFSHNCVSQSLLVIQMALTILVVCTFVQLSREEKDRLATQQLELARLDPRLDSFIELLKDRGFIAVRRLIRNPSMLAIKLVFAFFLSFNLFFLSPFYIKAGYEECPLLLMLFALLAAVGTLPGFVLFGYALEYSIGIFEEAATWIEGLSHTPLDLCRLEDFYSWMALRRFYIHSLLPSHYQRADRPFAICFLLIIGLVSTLVFLFLTRGPVVIQVPVPQMVFCAVFLVSYYLLRCLLAAIKIWNFQLAHLDLLSQVKVQLKLRMAEESLESETRDAKLVDAIDSYLEYLRENDPAPRLIGLPIKPTLLRVIVAYIISAVGVVVTKFLINGAA